MSKKQQDNISIKNELIFNKMVESTTCEIHMGQYPIFCLTTQKPDDTRLVFKESATIASAQAVKEWIIRVADDYGWPGEHEAEVWRAIQHLAELRARDGCLTNPIVTTLEEIRRHMSHASRGGRQRKQIIWSLSCLRHTNLETNFWYHADIKLHKHASFALIASLSWTFKELSNMTKIIDQVFIGFGPEMFKNIQHNYVRPLDKGFRDQTLKRWLSKRLYELLGLKFYALRGRDVPYKIRYSRLCHLLGTKPQQYLSRAKQILSPSHTELLNSMFISKVEWFPVKSGEQDWVLRYWPGPRAKAEWLKDYWKGVKEDVDSLFVEQLPPTQPLPSWVETLVPDESPLMAEVVTDRPPDEQPLTAPQADLEPEVVSESAKAPSAKKRATRPVRVRSEPDEALEAYTKAALKAFESATGHHRRMARVSDAEMSCLQAWKADGVSVSDIENGTQAAVHEQLRRFSETGSEHAEIWSLAYVDGHVRDARHARLKGEEEARIAALIKDAFVRARAGQSSELQQAEEHLRQNFFAKNKPKPLNDMILKDIVVVECSADSMVLLVNGADILDILNNWKNTLSQAANRPVSLVSPAMWVQRFHPRGL